MSRLMTWFDDGEPIWPTVRLESYFIQKLIIAGVWIIAVVDYPSAMTLSHLVIPPKKPINQSINSMTPPIVQHFYLRTSTAGLLTKDGAPVPPEHRGHPVGVIAMTFTPNGTIRFSGSLVSKKDVFLKKTGVAKAHGRLANDATAAELPVEQFKTFTTASLAATLGLYTKHGNRFNEIDWQRAELTKLSALDSLEARCGKQPA